jgi:hypothetical protein
VQAVARAKEWIEQHAKPHNAKIDRIDWMSASRFRQTRNYGAARDRERAGPPAAGQHLRLWISNLQRGA